MERFLHAVFCVCLVQFGLISANDDNMLLQVVNSTRYSTGNAPFNGGMDPQVWPRHIIHGNADDQVHGLICAVKCSAHRDAVCERAILQSRLQCPSEDSKPICHGTKMRLVGSQDRVFTIFANAMQETPPHFENAANPGMGTVTALNQLCPGMLDYCENNHDQQVIPDHVAPLRNAAGNANLDWTDGVRDGQYTEPNQQGNGFNVYVADTGVNCYHTDLLGRCEKVNDQFDSNRGPTCKGRSRRCAADKHGHGTHCAGTVGGTAVGVARGTRIGAVKVLSDSGSGSTAGVINGITASVAHCGSGNQCVLSMSLGGPGTSQAYVDAIDAALAAGVITVVAAGNSNDDACNYRPAHVPSAVTVGSTADTGSTSTVTMSYFSNYGTCIDVWAVGSSVNSLSYSSKTSNATMSGTSMACPAVAGAMAVILGWGYSGQAAIDYMTNTALSGIINSIPSSPPSPNLHMRLQQPSR